MCFLIVLDCPTEEIGIIGVQADSDLSSPHLSIIIDNNGPIYKQLTLHLSFSFNHYTMSSFTEKKYAAEEIEIENTQQIQNLYTPIDPPSRWSRIKTKVTTKQGWIGDYDYRALW